MCNLIEELNETTAFACYTVVQWTDDELGAVRDLKKKKKKRRRKRVHHTTDGRIVQTLSRAGHLCKPQ